MCRKVGPRVVWVTSNFMVCVAMAATALISFWSLRDYHGYVQDAITANASIKAVCLVLFAFLGVPLAVSASPRHQMQCHATPMWTGRRVLIDPSLCCKCRSCTASRSR